MTAEQALLNPLFVSWSSLHPFESDLTNNAHLQHVLLAIMLFLVLRDDIAKAFAGLPLVAYGDIDFDGGHGVVQRDFRCS